MGKRIDPQKQFSKRLATWTAVFWFFYMTLLAALCYAQPLVSDAFVYLAICVSIVMLINVGAYTRNSIYEKAILAGIDIGKLKWRSWGKQDNETDDIDGEGGDG